MKVTFIGAGAMGGLFGAIMTEAGLDVQLVDIWAEHVAAIKQNGLSIDHDGEHRTVKLDIYTDYRDTRPADLVIVFTKGYDTAEAAKAAQHVLTPDGLVLTIQNGLGNADVLAQTLPREKVITGTTAYACGVKGPGRIMHSGMGPSAIGPWGGAPLDKVQAVADLLTKATIKTAVKEDVDSLVWTKFLLNCGANAIVALCQMKNGDIMDLEISKELSTGVILEGLAVAKALKIEIRDDILDYYWDVLKEVGGNRASMGQDVDAKRRTEIDTLNGSIVRLGKEHGIDTPFNFALTALIKAYEYHYLND